MQDAFSRTKQLIGDAAFARITKCRVAVFGVGGVGSYTVEALARSGIGVLELFDKDIVDITNINRQLIALHSTLGQSKVAVCAARIADINPKAEVITHSVFVTPELLDEMDFSVYDYVVDAVDTVTAKIAICRRAREAGVPVISAMGAGNKLDPTGFSVAMMEKTEGCHLARVMRSELKKRGITGVKAVFSKEPVRTTGEIEGERRSPTPASIAYVPSVAGLILAGEVISDLMKG